jgi:acyl-CoA oxidase
LTHHLSSGLKSYESKITYEGLDAIRQACGGAGFSQWSGLPLLEVDYAPNTTFEGDNTVMM